jgi:hypothetical protein
MRQCARNRASLVGNNKRGSDGWYWQPRKLLIPALCRGTGAWEGAWLSCGRKSGRFLSHLLFNDLFLLFLIEEKVERAISILARMLHWRNRFSGRWLVLC